MDGLPASLSAPARRTSIRAASRRTIMSAIISWTSWKLRDRDAELPALLRVGDRGLDAAVADPDAARGDRVAARVERRHRDLEAVADLAQQRVVADLDAVERDRGGVGGAQAELAVDLLGGEAVGFGRDEEAGEALGASSPGRSGRRSARPRRSCRARSTSSAGDPPAAVDLLGPGAQVGGVGAGVGLGQAEAAERLAASRAAAASAASAPPCPSARSSRRRARSAPRPRCASPSRRGRPPRRSARRRRSRGRGRRTPRPPARPGSPSRRAGGRARGRTSRRGRSRGPAGSTSLSTNSRAVSAISRCSSVSSSHHAADRPASPSSAASARANACRASAVRGPGLETSRPSIAETGWTSRVVEARNASLAPSRSSSVELALLDVERLDEPRAGDRVEDPGLERRRPQLAVARPRRWSRSAPRARRRRGARAAPRRRRAPWRSGSPACWRRRRAT